MTDDKLVDVRTSERAQVSAEKKNDRLTLAVASELTPMSFGLAPS